MQRNYPTAADILFVRSLDIRDVVKDKEWQSLRRSFVGTWKVQPVKNTAILRDYLGDWSCPYRIRRVYNYLTGSAFRIGLISHEAVDSLLEEIRSVWRSAN